jgi:hypothetical protein
MAATEQVAPGVDPARRVIGSRAGRRTPLRRTGRVVFLVALVWIAAAVLVVFFRGLGQARARGDAEQLAAQYQDHLGAGWYPLEVDQLAPAAGSTQPAWIGLNYSRGSTSTITALGQWRRLSLRLSPVACADGKLPVVALGQGGVGLGDLTLAPGWSWYSVRLSGRAEPVTLRYSCVLTQRTPGLGLQQARQLAVGLAGIRGTG